MSTNRTADPGLPPEDLSGTVIEGRYEILQRESQGGMGAIYKARHVALESLVAVKVMLKPRNLREQERFLQEAQIASKIRHPNPVYLSDFGILPDGRPYLVMEFLSGLTLSQAYSPIRSQYRDWLRKILESPGEESARNCRQTDGEWPSAQARGAVVRAAGQAAPDILASSSQWGSLRAS